MYKPPKESVKNDLEVFKDFI